MSPSRMATSSSMALVDDLMKLIHSISLCTDAAVCQRRSCWNLTRLTKMLAPLFEEIREVKSPLPPLAVMKFQDLRIAFKKTLELATLCKDGSRICMFLDWRSRNQRFVELAEELSRAMDDLPLGLLAVSEEIKEQVQLAEKQLKQVKPQEEKSDDVLRAKIRVIVNVGDAQTVATLLEKQFEELGVTSAEAELDLIEREKDSISPESREGLALIQTALRVIAGVADTPEEGESVVEGVSGGGANGAGVQKAAPIPPDDFRCPISLDMMRDPTIVATGQTYERQYIEQWLKEGHKTCPKTQQVLVHTTLIPNYSLRNLISKWCEENGIDFPKKALRGGKMHHCQDQELDVVEEGDHAQVLALKEKLLTNDAELHRTAAEDVRKLAKRSVGNRVSIAEAGVIPLLVKLLLSKDMKTQEHAVTALLNLSILDSNKAGIAAAGAIDPIVHVLDNGSNEARENAAATLFSLSVIDENKISIGQSGAIPALVRLLETGQARGRKDAATALFNLAIYHGNKSRAVRAGVVPPLMKLLTDRSSGMTDEALAILAILTTSLEGRTTIGQAGVIPILVSLIDSGSPRNKENAASVLLSLCLNGEEHTKEALAIHAEVPVANLSRTGTQRARRKAGQLLQHFEEHSRPL
eukprot:TRINITY_DN1665_c0_g1_i1.p1 TRINITY_DN1665_c0_g1~~TRINITY_DN1665_c0_g1_i1.p1  ORF type:complete len:639 (-),score=78.94 TRINITY_DN1665_c0_g1_i1:1515-3431(-)